MRTDTHLVVLGLLGAAVALALAGAVQAAPTLDTDQSVPDLDRRWTEAAGHTHLENAQWAWFVAATFGDCQADTSSLLTCEDIVATIEAGLGVESIFGPVEWPEADVESLVLNEAPDGSAAFEVDETPRWLENVLEEPAAGTAARLGRPGASRMAPDVATLSVMGGGLVLGLTVRKRRT